MVIRARFQTPTPAAMRIASAGRRLVRGSSAMMNNTRRGSGSLIEPCEAESGAMLVKAEETVCAGDEIAHQSQSGEGGQIAWGEISLARRVRAGKQMCAFF